MVRIGKTWRKLMQLWRTCKQMSTSVFVFCLIYVLFILKWNKIYLSTWSQLNHRLMWACRLFHKFVWLGEGGLTHENTINATSHCCLALLIWHAHCVQWAQKNPIFPVNGQFSLFVVCHPKRPWSEMPPLWQLICLPSNPLTSYIQ